MSRRHERKKRESEHKKGKGGNGGEVVDDRQVDAEATLASMREGSAMFDLHSCNTGKRRGGAK